MSRHRADYQHYLASRTWARLRRSFHHGAFAELQRRRGTLGGLASAEARRRGPTASGRFSWASTGWSCQSAPWPGSPGFPSQRHGGSGGESS